MVPTVNIETLQVELYVEQNAYFDNNKVEKFVPGGFELEGWRGVSPIMCWCHFCRKILKMCASSFWRPRTVECSAFLTYHQPGNILASYNPVLIKWRL